MNVTNPTLVFTAHIGDLVSVRDGVGAADLTLTGDAVELLEALSYRAPLRQHVPESASWLLAGLGDFFETSST